METDQIFQQLVRELDELANDWGSYATSAYSGDSTEVASAIDSCHWGRAEDLRGVLDRYRDQLAEGTTDGN
jgi:hypothetical protein